MATKVGMVQQKDVLNEIIDNAVSLPIENQELLLSMAKAMRYTRKCVLQRNASDSLPCNCSEQMV